MAEKNDHITNRKELLEIDGGKQEIRSNKEEKGKTQERYESDPAENQSKEQSKNDTQIEILENRNHEGEDETNANENCSDFSEICKEKNEVNSSELPVDCLPVVEGEEECYDNALSMSIDIKKKKNHKKFICIDVNSYHKTKLVAISKFEIDLDFLKQTLRCLYKSDAIKNFTFEKSLTQLKTFSFGNLLCIPVYNVSELSDSDSESANENESYSGLQRNNQGEIQESVEPENREDNQLAADNRNFDELDSTSNSNEIRQQTAATGQAATSCRNPQENVVIVLRHVPVSLQRIVQENVVIDLRQVLVSSQRIVQENVFVDLRQVSVSSQRIVQAMEEIPNVISSPTDDNINVQNTPGSVSINSDPPFESHNLFEESEFHQGNTIPIVEPGHCQSSDGGPSEMCIGSVPRLSAHNRSTPINRALSQNQNHESSFSMFRGLPVMLQILSGSSLFYNTCTIDTPLMIIFYQMLTNRNLRQLFTNSIYGIFRTVLPYMLSRFMRRDYDDVRKVWGEIIGHSTRRNFYGSDASFMLHPFSSLLLYQYRFYCSNLNCPSNERRFKMPGMFLPCLPAGAYLDITTFQQLIDNFTSQLEYPCNEQLVQTVSESREENARYTYLPCRGHLLVTRVVRDIPEQPPMIMINMGWSGLQGRNIRDLNGTVQIGAYHYYIGGLTFAANNHFTGRILLPHLGMYLLYCNGQGIQELDDNEEHPDYLDSYLSLVILFRII
ncbi:unnamed protein product [Mytilus coruscus]|uniref:Uncharacterized protein n=1 Tax=Mytilus coruscus TaxID=42192 RepID=A0A6J8APG5_MYTCO|nr:unnamed protein product [Mytilus coruscus]